MTHYTPEDLIRYLYKETSASENSAIKAALDQDWALKEKFKILESSLKILDKATESPRTEVILRILNYAQKTMVEPVQ
ncbi:MAG: hypothetical protein INR73_12465 [Williamsia sp.]|nr:hypothetical protein [Williamsia sp.]